MAGDTGRRTVTVRTTAAGYEIRGADGLLVAFWRHEDVGPAERLPDGRRRLSCRADPATRLVLRPEARSRARPRRRLAAGLAAAAILLLAAAVTAGLARHGATPAAMAAPGPP